MPRPPLSRLRSGDRLAGIPATDWNSFIDAARFVQQQQPLAIGGGPLAAPAAGTVPIRNDSGADRARFEILRVSDFLIPRESNSDHFKSVPALIGAAPDSTLSQMFAILQEPIASGKVGRAMLSGITPVQIDVVATGDLFADTIDSDAAKLRSYPWGCCPILAKESGTGTKWAYVLMGTFRRGMLRGVADSVIAADATGTVSVYYRSGATAWTDTGYNVTALNDLDGDVSSSAVVVCRPEHYGTTAGWVIIQADCP